MKRSVAHDGVARAVPVAGTAGDWRLRRVLGAVAAIGAMAVSGCAMPWDPAPPGGTTITSTLTSMAAYQRLVAGARACYPWPSYKVEPDYFQPATKTGAMKLYEMVDSRKVDMVSFIVTPKDDGSSVNLKYRNKMSGFPSAAAAWLNGEPNRCPSR